MTPTHIIFFVEEPSMEAFLRTLLPAVVGPGVTFRIHQMGSKAALLGRIQSRLKAYSSYLGSNERILVLVDRDGDDCKELKERLAINVRESGLAYKSDSHSSTFQCAVRIAVEELESWILGDPKALRAVYPKVPLSFERKEAFRDPDNVRGGTWEALERLLRKSGYYAGGIPKVEVATRVARVMNVNENLSRSFQCFRDLLISL